MTRTGLVLLMGIWSAAASPVAAQDLVMSPEGAVTGSSPAVTSAGSDIPWEPRWTADTDKPATDLTASPQGGPPTPIIPTAYLAGPSRPAALR